MTSFLPRTVRAGTRGSGHGATSLLVLAFALKSQNKGIRRKVESSMTSLTKSCKDVCIRSITSVSLTVRLPKCKNSRNAKFRVLSENLSTRYSFEYETLYMNT
jgi:hypothetical protein